MAEEQFDILRTVLRKFQEAGILSELMLIGSWCLYFYRLEFKNAFPAIRHWMLIFSFRDMGSGTRGFYLA